MSIWTTFFIPMVYSMAQAYYKDGNIDPPPAYTPTTNRVYTPNPAVMVHVHQNPPMVVQRPLPDQANAKTLGILALVLSGIAFITCIVGTAIPYWLFGSANGITRSEGLWKLCGTSVFGGSACIKFPEETVHDWVKAVRAMEILGILLNALACGCGFLKLFVMKTQRAFPKLASISAVSAGLLMLIGVIVYGTKSQEALPTESLYHLHAGFGLCLVAGILAIIGGVMYASAYNRNQI